MVRARHGDTVRVHYRGTLEDGRIFSSTYEEQEPFEFTIGEGRVLPKFEAAVIGMREGDMKSLSLPPADAYGQHRKEFVFVMDRNLAPGNINLELGSRLKIRNERVGLAIATIVAVTEDSVVLDANEPLAGKVLNFEVELLKILKPRNGAACGH